jgi:hypothetical protein
VSYWRARLVGTKRWRRIDHQNWYDARQAAMALIGCEPYEVELVFVEKRGGKRCGARKKAGR